MKILRNFILLIFTLFISCQQKNESASQNPVEPEVKAVPTRDLTGCYQMVIEQDTAFMQLNQTGDSVSGTLFYHPFEKDKNEGRFHGIRTQDNVLDIWYNFESEGKDNVRQSYFKIWGDSLAEGYGDVTMKSDTIVFKYPRTTINYEEKHPFKKINCP